MAEYSTDVRHIAGKSNVVADTLSRAVCSAVAVDAVLLPTVDYAALALDQAADEVVAYRTAVTGLTFADVRLADGVTVLCDTSTGKPRPVVPANWTRRVFDAVHGLSHAGPRPTQRAVAAKFVWHGLKADVRQWCRECPDCQAAKIGTHVHAPLVSRPPPDRRFGSLHVDLVGPLPASEGHIYLFTIIDRFSRWPEAIPLADAEAVTCARALLRGWIARFGVPDDITSDRGPQFTSCLWAELGRTLGIHNHATTAYHPQANGMVERMHRQLKGALKARLVGPNWMDELPIVLLGLRTAWREGADASAAELVYGCSLHIPGEFVPGTDRAAVADAPFLRHLQDAMRAQLPPAAAFHDSPPVNLPASLAAATHVYVRHDARRSPLQWPYDGPFPVLEHGAKAVVISRNGKPDTVSVDRLKAAYLPAAAPPQTLIPPPTLAPPPALVPPQALVPQQLLRPPPAPGPALPQPPPDHVPPLQPPVTRAGRIVRKPARLRD